MPKFANDNDTDLDDVIQRGGYDPRRTPIDTLMGDVRLGLEFDRAMRIHDDYDD